MSPISPSSHSCVLTRIFLGLALAGSTTSLLAQSGVITSDSLTPFEPRDAGAVSDAKTVRLRLNHPLALSSIAIAPGFNEFSLGAVSGCVVDGNTINPVFTVCEVPVTFQPKYPGLRTAPLVVTDNTGLKYQIGLEGAGLAPQAALTPGIINRVTKSDGTNLSGPNGLAVDQAGNLYVSNDRTNVIQKMDPAGVVSTIEDKFLFNPGGLITNAQGEVLYTDGPAIKKIDLNGQIIHVAGNGRAGFSGDGGPATDAEINTDFTTNIAVDAAGNIYIPDFWNFRIRKVDTNGIITTVAGTGTDGYSGDGGPATSAAIGFALSVAVDQAGNLYFGDYDEAVIRKVDTNGVITTIAGGGTSSGDGGLAINAELISPTHIQVDAAGNLYFIDGLTLIRRIDTLGTITTIAGYPLGSTQAPNHGDGGPANLADFMTSNIALDSAGNLYIDDTINGYIRKVDVSKSAVPFAAHTVGTTSPARRVVLTNTGNQHLDLGALDVTGDFGLLSGNDPSYCSSLPGIGAGASCALPVTFSPTAAGALTGLVTVTDNSLNQPGTMQSVALTGTGVTQ